MLGHGNTEADPDLTAILIRLRTARQSAQTALQDAEQRAVQFMDAELRARECVDEHRTNLHRLNADIDEILELIPRQDREEIEEPAE